MINETNALVIDRPKKKSSYFASAAQFVLAVALATMLGCVAQTQINLAALIKLGADIPLTLRLDVTLQDLMGFGPIYFALVLTAFIPALALAMLAARRFPQLHDLIFILAGGLSLLLTFILIDAFAPMPTLIAATREFSGTLLMMIGGSLGGWLFGRCYGRGTGC